MKLSKVAKTLAPESALQSLDGARRNERSTLAKLQATRDTRVIAKWDRS
jgi:hypothetical protein